VCLPPNPRYQCSYVILTLVFIFVNYEQISNEIEEVFLSLQTFCLNLSSVVNISTYYLTTTWYYCQRRCEILSNVVESFLMIFAIFYLATWSYKVLLSNL